MSDDVELTMRRGVARLILRRPQKRNAVTAAMWVTIIEKIDQAAATRGVNALLVQGSGGSFCAGADLSEVRTPDGTQSREYRQIFESGIRRLHEFPVPTVAFIDGACVGGGCSIALACDVRFATPNARFAIPAVKYGFVIDDLTLQRLVELIGSGRATHLMLSGATIGGERASSIGLIEHCSADAQAQCEGFLNELRGSRGPAANLTRRRIRRFAGLASTEPSLCGIEIEAD